LRVATTPAFEGSIIRVVEGSIIRVVEGSIIPIIAGAGRPQNGGFCGFSSR